jgi:penicillin amidase
LDKYLRELQFERVVNNELMMLKPEHRGILEAYAAGVNAYVSSISMLPFEFWKTGAKFVPWTPKDSLMVFKLFSFELSGNWKRTILRTLVKKQMGKEWAERLFPLNDPLLEDTVTISLEESNETHQARMEKAEDVREEGNIFKIGGRGARQYMANAWVIHGNFTDIHKPILATDLLFEKQIPGVFYLAGLRFPSKDVITGGTIVGVPAVFIGRNRDLAWGIAGHTLENMDVYEVKLDEAKSHYMLNGNYVPLLNKREEVINVKGGKSINHIVYSTVYGPLIQTLNGLDTIRIPR